MEFIQQNTQLISDISAFILGTGMIVICVIVWWIHYNDDDFKF